MTDVLNPASQTGKMLHQISDYWLKIEHDLNPENLSQEDKIFIDFAFKFLEEAPSSEENPEAAKARQEEIEFFRSYSEQSLWVRPLSDYLEKAAQKFPEAQRQDLYKKMVKKLRYSFQSNLLASYQSFSSHIPLEAYKNAVSLEKIDKFFEKCMFFDGEFAWNRDAIIIPGNMKAFSFNDENQDRQIYVFARYGSAARKQVVDAMSHYHALNSFKYTDEIDSVIAEKFNNRQAFKKYFSFYYQRAMTFFNDLEKLDQNEIEFCKEFIFPRPNKLFLPRHYDALPKELLEKKIIDQPARNRERALNASIMYNLGKEEEALQYLAKHLEESPNSVSMGRHLGFLLLLKGRKEEGLRLLSRFLKKNHQDFVLASYQISRLVGTKPKQV